MTVVLEAPGVRAEIDSANGARLVSLQFEGHEVLAVGRTPEGVRIGDGCFAMAPWAGRISGGRIEHGGVIARCRSMQKAMRSMDWCAPWRGSK